MNFNVKEDIKLHELQYISSLEELASRLLILLYGACCNLECGSSSEKERPPN